MNNQKLLNRIALDDLFERLGLSETSESFKTKFSEDIVLKFQQLLTLKLKQLLPEEQFEKFMNSSEDKQDEILKENKINLQENIQFTADFLREHLEDYSKGVAQFLSENK